MTKGADQTGTSARGIVEMIVAMTISGTIGWFVLISGQSALDAVFWRCVFGAMSLAGVCAAMGVLSFRLTMRQLGLALFGGVAIVLNWLLLFGAYRYASVSIATAIYNTQPFMLLAFGALIFSERITIAKLGWLVMAFAGLLLIVSHKPAAGYVGGQFALGIAMAACAAFGWAVAAVTTKQLAGVPPQLVALIHVGTGCLLLAPFASWANLPTDLDSWGALVALGAIHTGLMYAVMYSAVQKLPTYMQGSLSFIYPAVAVLVDVAALGVRLDQAQLVGIAVILIAAAGMNWRITRLPAVRLPYLGGKTARKTR